MTHRPALALSTALAAAAAVLAGAAGAAPAAADPISVNPNLSPLRQDTVERANKALNTPRKFKLAGSETIHYSTVLSAKNRNVFEVDGSNANRVVYNGYNGNAWCGSFVAAMWTGHNMPDPSSYPRIPTSFQSSQAWATDPKLANLWHPFSGADQKLPKPGDVLVWKNDGDSWSGHVGLVVKTLYGERDVVTVEGNVKGDEVAKFRYHWGAEGPVRSGKTFRGYTSRE